MSNLLTNTFIFKKLLLHCIGLAAAAAKSLQSCPTLCNPIDSRPPGSPVPGILQARTLEWVAIAFSNAWKWKVKGKSLSHVQLLATPRTAAHQAPPSMGFSRQEHWSGVPSPSAHGPLMGAKSAWNWGRNIFMKVKVKLLSCVQLFVTPRTAAFQAPPSMGFSRQEYWSRLPFPSPADLPDPGIKPGLPHCRQTLYHEPPGNSAWSWSISPTYWLKNFFHIIFFSHHFIILNSSAHWDCWSCSLLYNSVSFLD